MVEGTGADSPQPLPASAATETTSPGLKAELVMGLGPILVSQLCEPHQPWDDAEDAKCPNLSGLQ